jgi:hypothetical protein
VTTDYRDLALEHAAQERLELLDALHAAEGRAATYREMAQALLDVAHTLTLERHRLTARVRQLLDQLRASRDSQRGRAA